MNMGKDNKEKIKKNYQDNLEIGFCNRDGIIEIDKLTPIQEKK